MENYIALVKNPDTLLSVQGMEAMSLGENFDLFFKEFSTSIDRRMAALSKSIHQVDYSAAKRNIEANKILYVKNTGVEMITPEGFQAGMGNMMAHTKAVVDGVYIVCSLKTEAARLYDWLKQIIKNGRVDKSFGWTIKDFDTALNKAENFVKNLPDNSRRLKFNLGQVYFNFDEFFACMITFNHGVSTLGGRDIELLAKELTNVHELGTLMVKKIKANELLVSEQGIADVEAIVNKFVSLTNLAGALLVLLNDLTAVFNEQAKTIAELK
jgi:hypothetical protein